VLGEEFPGQFVRPGQVQFEQQGGGRQVVLSNEVLRGIAGHAGVHLVQPQRVAGQGIGSFQLAQRPLIPGEALRDSPKQIFPGLLLPPLGGQSQQGGQRAQAIPGIANGGAPAGVGRQFLIELRRRAGKKSKPQEFAVAPILCGKGLIEAVPILPGHIAIRHRQKNRLFSLQFGRTGQQPGERVIGQAALDHPCRERIDLRRVGGGISLLRAKIILELGALRLAKDGEMLQTVTHHHPWIRQKLPGKSGRPGEIVSFETLRHQPA